MSQQCVFCSLANATDTAPVYQGEHFVVVHDINPQAPVHLLFIPKKHCASLEEVTAADTSLLGEIMAAMPVVARKFSIDQSGYKVIINTGKHGGQTVSHLHFHLLGGKQMPSLF